MTTQREVALMISPHSPSGESWGSPRGRPTICSKTSPRSVPVAGQRVPSDHPWRSSPLPGCASGSIGTGLEWLIQLRLAEGAPLHRVVDKRPVGFDLESSDAGIP